MARTYKRDSRGRFSGGGGGGGRPAARGVSRGTNRLTRDNAGRITSVGGNGATARGGRLRTASGKKRATQTAKVSGGRAAGTVTRSGARRTAAAAAKPTTRAAAAAVKPARRNTKLGFTESDFARRSQRTVSIRNPEVKAKAQRLYGRVMDTGQTPRQLRSMFKKAGKPKAKTATAAARRMQREHRDMMAASRVLFR